MGIFSDYVMRLHQSGIYCVPCGDKKQPVIGRKWERYCDTLPTEKEVEGWEKEFVQYDRLGMLMGEQSGFVAFDFDYEWDEKKSKIPKSQFDKDKILVEKQILALLPPTPCKKIGAKGWTGIYRWNDKLKNTQADRNGVRLFDFLVWHKQTIIPPSLHSVNTDGQELYYKWQGIPLSECIDDIPEITMDVVNEIKFMFEDAGSNVVQTRHSILLKYILAASQIENDPERLIDKLIDRDNAVNSPPYLSDPKHHKNTDPRENARYWIQRILRWRIAMKKDQGETKQYINNDSWDHFFETSFYKIRKDIISKEMFTKKNDKAAWVQAENLEQVLKAYAFKKGLSRTHVKEQMSRWIYETDKMDFLCDIPKWDGVDRIEQIANCIMSPMFEPNEIADILNQWGSNIYRRVESSNYQNRCIILKGKQKLGKDSLVRSMVSDFKPYYNTTNFSGTQKDVLEIVSRLLVVHIEEFEQTRGLDIGFLKSIITQPTVFFRESYGASPNEKVTSPSFISTANIDDLLRDTTGNRRFIILPIDKIVWDYPRHESIQVMAQWKSYFELGLYKELSAETEIKISGLLDKSTPEDLSVMVVERYIGIAPSFVKPYQSKNGDPYLTYSDALPCISQIAKEAQCGIRRVQSILKAKGFVKHIDVGNVYFTRSKLEDMI